MPLFDTYELPGMYIRTPQFIRALRHVRALLEPAFEASGYLPSLLPSLIPESVLAAEASHIDGFRPLVYWVTEVGEGTKLEERLALPISSETVYCLYFKRLVARGAGLPLQYYQERNVFRSENKTVAPLEREREFLWHECHTAFATHDEAQARLDQDRDIVGKLLTDLRLEWEFCERDASERCPGAIRTFAFDVLMPNGARNQVASLHHLGSKFSSVFDLCAGPSKTLAEQTSTGVGLSRLIWAMGEFASLPAPD